MKKPTVSPIMWCMQQKGGHLMHSTLAFSKAESQQKLFDNAMDDDFRSKYWKKWPESLRAYRKMGYRAIRVRIEPQVRCWACLREASGKSTSVAHVCGGK
jgi:CRISPR/Cas system endoribonuclease Cas6 (RAMP superfamily)